MAFTPQELADIAAAQFIDRIGRTRQQPSPLHDSRVTSSVIDIGETEFEALQRGESPAGSTDDSVVTSLNVLDANGHESDGVSRMIFPESIIHDDGGGQVTIHSGPPVYMSDTEHFYGPVSQIGFTRATLNESDPNQIIQDLGGGLIVVHVPVGVDVAGDSGSVDNAEILRFHGATVGFGGGAQADVYITPGVSVFGDTGAVADAIQLNLVGADVIHLGGGVAQINIDPGITVVGNDNVYRDNIQQIHFPDALVSQSGSAVYVYVLPSAPGTGTFGLASTNDAYYWLDTTSCP